MIDFQNAQFVKLRAVNNNEFANIIFPMFVQGLTGTKKDFTSLPYRKISAYSVETAGVLDLDSELELWFSGLGKVKFEFSSNSNVSQICQIISAYTL